MNVPDRGTPKPGAAPVPELATDLASIDFNFLDEPVPPAKPHVDAAPSLVPDEKPAPQPMMEPIPAHEAHAPADPLMEEIPPLAELDLSLPGTNEEEKLNTTAEVPSAGIDIPDLPELSPAPTLSEEAESKAENNNHPVDFDLSDISLELAPSMPTDTLPDLAPDQPGHTVMELSSSEAEMATKLDLAIAYQEIGDKEGARELLDEVLKGGSPEQSEKARALLLELA